MTLEQIAIKHKTQKVPHGYMPIYERHFEPMRREEIVLVEIGIASGASLKTWREYFSKAEIIGLEKDLRAVDEFNAEFFNQGKIYALPCDVNDKESVEYAKEYFTQADIIIDDGSHWAHEQLNAFKHLWDNLKDGGWYVIEDLFALYDPVWNPKPHYSIIDEIKKRIDSVLVEGDPIQEIHIYGRNDINGIMFLRKRSEQYRIQPLSEFNL